MKLKALLATFSCIFLFSQSVFAVESEEAKIAQNLLKLKALNSCLECNLSGADLTNADLAKADLSDSNLSGANLTGANLSAADLSYADLSYADLKNADFSGATLKNIKIQYTIFCNTKTPWGLDNSGCK